MPRGPVTERSRSSFLEGRQSLFDGGYVRVKVPDDDPMAVMRDASGYVLEHRLVMARKLGRPLLPG